VLLNDLAVVEKVAQRLHPPAWPPSICEIKTGPMGPEQATGLPTTRAGLTWKTPAPYALSEKGGSDEPFILDL
jgi:hypothetical protein